MNTTILREEIRWLLEAIQEQYEVVRKYEDKIPQIELDILLDNVRKLYSKLHLVCKTNDPFSYPGTKTSNPGTTGSGEVARADSARKSEESAEEKESPVKSHEETGSVNPSKKKPPPDDRNPEPDLFSSEMAGFSGKLQEARLQVMPLKSRSSKRNDLKALISINEKFLFINELFDGNLREYNENIEALCRFTELKSALEFLDLARKKNLWNSESKAFNRLRELLEIRFSQ
jgi:hypothetical protein